MAISDKVSVVTGGTKGIGYAIAKKLLEKEAKVFICARSKSEIRDAISDLSKYGQVAGEVCDVRSEDQVRMMIGECERVFGGVDILINSAGVGINGKTVEE